MKIKITAAAAILLLLLVTGCNGDFQERLDDLKARTASLEEQCLKLNGNLTALSGVIRAMESYDLVTGTTVIKENGKEIGYTINFQSSASVTVYNGVDGSLPFFNAKADTDGSMYWTVRYGEEGKIEWLLDDDGNKVLAVGEIPYVTITDDIWKYTLDGKNWIDLGPARGEDADTMFSKVDLTDSLFVVFEMADGTSLKIPRYEAYTKLLADVKKANEDIEAQRVLLENIVDNAVYIVSVEDRLSGGERTGVKVSLSDGTDFVINDWTESSAPVVLAEKDSSDGIFYWACRYAGNNPVWITDSEGNKIRAAGMVDDVPVVSIEKKGGRYYWYVSYRDGGHFLLDSYGNRLDVANMGSFAADSVQYRVFKSVTDNEDCLEIVLDDEVGTQIKLMKQFAVQLYAEGSYLNGKVLTVPEGVTVDVLYWATGAQVKDVVAMKEGDISVTVDLKKQIISIGKQSSGTGAASFIFTFSEAASTNTKFIKLEVK